MFSYLQVKHTKEGDVHGQKLMFDRRDEWLLEYHTQMKNAINNSDVIGMDIIVLNNQLKVVFSYNWTREPQVTGITPTQE